MSEHTIQCWSCGTRKTLDEILTADGYCPECEVEIDLAEYYPTLASDYDALVAERDGLRDDLDECDGDRWKLRSERDRLAAENERLRSTLKDPEAVLVNMLRGEIAIPSVRSWSKLFGQVLNDDDQRLLEIARLRAENVILTGTVERQANSIAELRARVAELERDAERYRWLRERCFSFSHDEAERGISTMRWGEWYYDIPESHSAQMDMAIDAAMAAHDKQSEGG
jgi:chromosome segregation ATPase